MSETLNKTQFVEAVAEKAGMSKAEAGKAVDAVIETVTATLKAKGAINIPGFGKFATAEKPERTGRNPSTGAEVKIAARTAPKFTPGKGLKDAVNG